MNEGFFCLIGVVVKSVILCCFRCQAIFSLTFLFSIAVFSKTVNQKAEDFFSWLNKNEKLFISCKIQKNGDDIILCDNTKVSYKEIKDLFRKPVEDIIANLKKKDITVEILCLSEPANNEKALPCVSETANKTFKNVSSLHGLYLPDEKKILIRSNATAGILIHEYIHHLQSINTEKIFDRVYKKEKNILRQEIQKELEITISEVTNLERSGNKAKAKEKVDQFIKTNEYMFKFSKWQDLIDERSLFLLFKKFEKDFQISEADIQFTNKNIKFICDRKDYSEKLSECN